MPKSDIHSKYDTCIGYRTKRLVSNVTIFVKLPLNTGHLSITYKFFKTRRCPLVRGFTVQINGRKISFNIACTYVVTQPCKCGTSDWQLSFKIMLSERNVAWKKNNLKDVEMHSDQKKHLVLLEFPYIIKINKKRLANKNSSISDGT